MINSSSSDEAKARYARFWGQLPLTQEQRAAQQPKVWEPNQYGGLGQYETGAADKLARRQGESPESWRRRVTAVGRHLPEEELAARLAAIDAAEQPQTFEQLRTDLNARQSGVDRGLYGAMSPQQRAAAAQPVRGNSMSNSPIAQQGHLAGDTSTPGQVGVRRVYASEIKADEIPQRSANYLADLGIRSSGSGWVGADR